MSKISVIIPVYNAAQYLLRTIKCLREQTICDMEVLLIDDGSSDGSAAICQDIVRNDQRFVYIYQENQGVSSARNNGLSLCEGEYVAFIDADDIIPPNYLEALLETLEKNQAQMSICDVAVITNEVETGRFSCPADVLTQQEALNYLLSRKSINSGPYAKLYRRDILNEVQFPLLKAYEDILFVVDAINKCSRIASTNLTEYQYIQNTSGIMSVFLKTPSSDIVVATEKLLCFLKQRKELDPYCFYITVSHLMQYVLPTIRRNTAEARNFIQLARALVRKYQDEIWRCPAFPRKEKITYWMFTLGWIYHERKISKLR